MFPQTCHTPLVRGALMLYVTLSGNYQKYPFLKPCEKQMLQALCAEFELIVVSSEGVFVVVSS
eukprot:m.10718 g.10718  ORF g.10718 m.10718 type:complete len:63 (-) comp4309_c0_seq1:2791-2979(-)